MVEGIWVEERIGLYRRFNGYFLEAGPCQLSGISSRMA